MEFNIRVISSYVPEICGIATHSQDLITALGHIREVDSIRVAAIDRSNGQNVYQFPVDLVINQYDENSWYQKAGAILERSHAKTIPTVVFMQHEYGLSGRDALGNDYQNMARIFKEGGRNSVTIANLHTVLEHPNEHQRKVIQEISELAEGIIVPTQSAVEILSSETYNISPSKLKHIDHGIRIHDLSQVNPNEIKAKYNLEGKLVVGTLGLKSDGKGIEFGIEAYGRMINKHLQTSEERKKIIYLIAGQYHPGFIEISPKVYKDTQSRIEEIIKEQKLRAINIDNLETLKREDIDNNDLIIYEKHIGERELRDLYIATDIVLLPYRNKQQISSGILSDAVGSGNPIIATKFAHARELLCPGVNSLEKGIIGDNPNSRGILVDLVGRYENTPSVSQLTKALEYLVLEEKAEEARSQIAQNVRSRGHEMSWENVTRDYVQYCSLLLENKFAKKPEPVIITRDEESKEKESKKEN